MHPVIRLGELLFRWRSFTPIPLALWIAARARPQGRWIVPGLGLALVGLALRLWAARHIGPKSRTRSEDGPPHRAVGGPYRVLDHPLYVGNGLLSEGLVIASGAGWPWLQIVFPLFWLLQYLPIMLWEEARLSAQFGRAAGRATGRPDNVAASNWGSAWTSERRTRQSVILFIGAMLVVGLLRGVGERRTSP